MRLKKFPVIALVLTLMVSLLVAPPATAKPKPKGTISGTVTFQGKPVADAYVFLNVGSLSARTDSKGRYSLKVPVSSYKVSSWSREHSTHETYTGGVLRKPDAKKTKVRKGRTTRVSIELVPAGTIKGRVLDAEGRPVADAELEARNVNRPGGVRPLWTDSEGYYTAMHLSPGKVEITADWSVDDVPHDGRVIAHAKAGRTSTAPDIVVRPYPRGRITAEVEWPEGPQDDWVTALNKDNDEWVQLEQDPETQLWSAKVPPGQWRIVVEGNNVATKTVRVEDGETVHAGRLVVPEARGTLTGKVLRKNGKPAKYGQVSVVDSFGFPSGVATIKKDGRYTVRGLPPGKNTVSVENVHDTWGERPAPQRVLVTAGETTKAILKLERGHTVRGKVTHRAKGVRGITVRLWPSGHIAKTNAQGEFTFRRIARGKYTLEARDNSPVYRYKSQTIKVRGDMVSVRVKLKK